jgi:hypothetical protein
MTVMRCNIVTCNVKEMNVRSSVGIWKRVDWLIMGFSCDLKTLNRKWHSQINMGQGKLQNKCQ